MLFAQKKRDKVCIMQYSRRRNKKEPAADAMFRRSRRKTLDEREGLPSRSSVQTTKLYVCDMKTSSPFIPF